MTQHTETPTAAPLDDDEPAFTDEELGAEARPRMGFGRFIRDIVIILVVLAGAMFAYNKYVTTKEKVEELANEARTASKRNDYASLKKGEKLYLEALELDGDGRVEAALAENYLFQHSIHGIDTKSKASQHLSAAEAAGAETPPRFAVAAYLKIIAGQPEAAEKMIKDLLAQDKSAPALAHALGWAKMEQGDFVEGLRVMGSASDADFSAVAYRMTLAEGAHRQGSPKAAIKHLDGIVRPTINSEHQLARAYLAALRLASYGNLTSPMKHLAELEKIEGEKSPRTQAFEHWAKAELQLSISNPKLALEEIAKAKELLADFPPFLGLEARAQLAQGKADDAIATYEKAIATKPLYYGLKWDLAELKSERGDDAALTLVDELEKAQEGTVGPEFEIFRGEHALRKNDLEGAKSHFTAAADLGDDPTILLGLAKVAFEEESKKGKRASLDAITEPLQRAMDAQKYFPEAQELYGDVNLWNYLIDGASAAYAEGEKQMKQLKKPIPEVLAFYDRVIGKLQKAKDRKIRRQTAKLAGEWQQKKKDYIASLAP